MKNNLGKKNGFEEEGTLLNFRKIKTIATTNSISIKHIQYLLLAGYFSIQIV
jgi:hypothetical protein